MTKAHGNNSGGGAAFNRSCHPSIPELKFKGQISAGRKETSTGCFTIAQRQAQTDTDRDREKKKTFSFTRSHTHCFTPHTHTHTLSLSLSLSLSLHMLTSRQRSSTLLQSKVGLPSFMLTALCAMQSQLANAGRLLTSGGFSSMYSLLKMGTAHQC